jgi:hypothetical protein
MDPKKKRKSGVSERLFGVLILQGCKYPSLARRDSCSTAFHVAAPTAETPEQIAHADRAGKDVLADSER